jgi:hypothetical protein
VQKRPPGHHQGGWAARRFNKKKKGAPCLAVQVPIPPPPWALRSRREPRLRIGSTDQVHWHIGDCPPSPLCSCCRPPKYCVCAWVAPLCRLGGCGCPGGALSAALAPGPQAPPMPAAAASIMSKREEGASCSPGISMSGAGGIKRQKTDVTADAGFATADGELGPESQLQTESVPVKLRQVALDVRQDLHRTNCRNTRMSERSWSGCQAAGCFPTPGRDWGDLDPPGGPTRTTALLSKYLERK